MNVPAPPTIAGATSSSSSANAQVADSENWMRLSLANNLHGTESMKEVLENDFKVTINGRDFHLWISNARKKRNCKMQNFVWENLLGACTGGCPSGCNAQTDLSGLDVTSLHGIFSNLEHIIPSSVLSQHDIRTMKLKYKVHFESIKVARNYSAHYSLKSSMPNNDFQREWNRIRNALVAMKYTKIKMFDDLEQGSVCLLYTSPSPRDS